MNLRYNTLGKRMLHLIALAALALAVSDKAANAETIWLAANGPYPPAGIPGVPDFMELFNSNGPWRSTSQSIKVIQFSTQFMAWVPDEQIKVIIDDLNRRGIALAIESLAQSDAVAPQCGQGVEGYGHPKEVALIAAKIKRAGGTLGYLAMDEPLFFGHYYDGSGACHSTITNVAERVADVLAEYKKVFPNVVIGDIEPAGAFRRPEWAGDYHRWTAAFREKVGTPLAFLRVDIDWNNADPKQALQEGIELAGNNGLGFQVIYNGRDTDKSDAAWIASAKANIGLIESYLGHPPESVVFESWVAHPTYLLPETSPTTLTGLIAWYIAGSPHP